MANKKLYFMGPRQIHTIATKRLRECSAPKLLESLSHMCDSYWEFYTNVHDKQSLKDAVVQSWYYMQAYRAVLNDWGWWDLEINQPKDWMQEE